MNEYDKYKYLMHINNNWLDWLWVYSTLIKDILKLWENYSTVSLLKRDTIDDWIFHIITELNNGWYMKEQLWSTELRSRFILTSKWHHFIKNYDDSFSKKIDNYLWKYPNISKLFYFILWLIIWLLPTTLKFII